MLEYRTLHGKIVIRGVIECLTGLHIGASKENLEIGAIDLAVARDPMTHQPYIPGSSLKGKLRSLLEKALAKLPERSIGTDVKIHVCDDFIDAVNCQVCRVFGSTGKGEGKRNFPARLIVRDACLTQESLDKLSQIDTGLRYTEWKFENAIDRVTSAANPRQIERVPRGAEFTFEFVYNVEDNAQMKEDITNIRLALQLIELDALGGHGSRGYGQVKFNIDTIEAKSISYFKGEVSDSTYKKVSSFEELSEVVALYQ